MDFRYVHAETCFGDMWLVIVVLIVVTGSCRPVLRSVVRRHVYETEAQGEFAVFMFHLYFNNSHDIQLPWLVPRRVTNADTRTNN